jgi:Amt family ammonium transporter
MEDQLESLTTILTEFYYWVTVALMFLIHAGFMLYEAGVARRKNVQHTVLKNVLLIPVVTMTFFFFGWWIYFAFTNGPGLSGGLRATDSEFAYPWSDIMGVNMGDRINGVFWAAFLLFSWTAASIISGSIIERARIAGFLVIAVLIGSVAWIIDASWGWHPEGWMVQIMGYHDAYASGVIHAIAGGMALGVLIVMGPRIGKFAADGTARIIRPHNIWLVAIGLFLIYTGFWGFYVACNVPVFDIDLSDEGTFFSATNIYLMPTTLSAITVNFLVSLAGGLMAGYLISRGDLFWTFSGGLAGIIAASAGNDLYHPMQAFLIAIAGVVIAYKLHYYVERRFKIDDVVGAVAVHGYAGFFGVAIAGFVLWGYPAATATEAGLAWFSTPDGDPAVNPIGNLLGAVIMFGVLGFLPGYGMAKLLDRFGLLRVPRAVEAAGLDTHDSADVYPYFQHRETEFETVERAEMATLIGVPHGNGRAAGVPAEEEIT